MAEPETPDLSQRPPGETEPPPVPGEDEGPEAIQPPAEPGAPEGPLMSDGHGTYREPPELVEFIGEATAPLVQIRDNLKNIEGLNEDETSQIGERLTTAIDEVRIVRTTAFEETREREAAEHRAIEEKERREAVNYGLALQSALEKAINFIEKISKDPNRGGELKGVSAYELIFAVVNKGGNLTFGDKPEQTLGVETFQRLKANLYKTLGAEAPPDEAFDSQFESDESAKREFWVVTETDLAPDLVIREERRKNPAPGEHIQDARLEETYIDIALKSAGSDMPDRRELVPGSEG